MKSKGISLFGFSFLPLNTVREAVELLLADADADAGGAAIRYLITPNASTIVYYAEPQNSGLKDFYSHADYILADGMPIVWTSRLKRGEPLPARIAGSDLFPELWEGIKSKRAGVLMVLGNERLAAFFREDYNRSAVLVPKMFDAADHLYIESLAVEVAQQVMAKAARFIFLGLNFPKQELLGMAMGKALARFGHSSPVTILLLGASCEFYAGQKARAPRWMQHSGLEWLYRFAKEPVRLGKRYTVDNLRFLIKMGKELIG